MGDVALVTDPCAVVADGDDGWLASLCLEFARRDEGLDGRGSAVRTALTRRRHRGPLMVQKPLYPEGAAICHAVILHPPAGMAGGDRLDIDVEVRQGAHALLTTPGATKWYKAAGRRAVQNVRLRLDADARLDWLPQENILFNETRAGLALELEAAPGAAAIGWDACLFGRRAAGERWTQGELASDATLRRSGRLLWRESWRLTADDPLRASPQGMAGFETMATLWALGPAVDAALTEELAQTLPFTSALRAGVTSLPTVDEEGDGTLLGRRGGVLLLRVLGAETEAVRAVLIDAWTWLRPRVLGVPAQPLRLWAT